MSDDLSASGQGGLAGHLPVASPPEVGTERPPQADTSFGLLEPSRGGMARLLRDPGRQIEIALPILVFVLLSLFGVTTSSLAINYDRQNFTDSADFSVGTPRASRSDEFLRTTPMQLGVLAAGDTVSTPLAEPPDLVTQIPDSGIAETIVFFDTAVLRLGPWLPDAMLFAAVKWFPILLFVLFCPLWFQRLGASRRAAWFGTGIILLSPSAAWWSYSPITNLGFAVTGSYLIIIATEHWQLGRRWTGALVAGIGGLLLTRLVSGYIPWSLIVGVPVVIATAVWLIWDKRQRIAGVVYLGIGALSATVALGATLLENIDSLRAQFASIYPGQRRSTGRPLDPGELFNAPVLFKLQYGTTLKLTNTSEISSAYTIALIWAIILVCFSGRFKPTRNNAALATILGFCGCWLSWITLQWGPLGERIPILNLLTPGRVAQTIGICAVMALTLALSRWTRPSRPLMPILLAGTCALITGYGASFTASTEMPELTAIDIAAGAGGVAAVVFAITRFPDRAWPYLIATALAASSVFAVNPITIGLGDYRNSASAHRMLDEGAKARANGELWASNLWYTDAMLNATGTPIIGGNQMSGPNREQWLKLDPNGQFEESWNRGASIIKFVWVENTDIVISTPQFDLIVVEVDPCTLRGIGFNVTHVISTKKLSNSCLTPEPSLEWFNIEQFVYGVQ